MEARQDGRAPGELLHAAARSSSLAGSTAEAVDQILASTEQAVAAIRARTEEQVRQIAADLEARAFDEAVERRAQLERVRRELADRASMIATAYEAVSQQLWAIDAALAGLTQEASAHGRQIPPQQSPGLTGRVTLRERQRINLPYDEAVASIPTSAVEQVAQVQPAPIDEQRTARRWWAPWQREAA